MGIYFKKNKNMDFIKEQIASVTKMQTHKLVLQTMEFVAIVVSAVMIWNCLKLGLHTSSPVVVVLSGSMEPAMYRGDILLLHKNTPIEVGDITVYELDHEAIPIVHRVTAV